MVARIEPKTAAREGPDGPYDKTRAVKRGGLDGPGRRHATMDREARQGFLGAPWRASGAPG